VRIYDDLYKSIEHNIAKKESDGFTSILCPFSRLSNKGFPGWVKGTYTILTASSGIEFNKYLL